MNRRKFLTLTASGIAALALPNVMIAAPVRLKPANKWWTHEQLLCIYNQVVDKTTQETINLDNPVDWQGTNLPLHEAFYLATIRMSNYMHRKTLDGKSKRWMVVSPSMCDRGVFAGYQFGEYSTPGKPGGVWTQKGWRAYIQDEVSPGVFLVGYMNGRWAIYVDERFPEGIAMQGMGYKEVVLFRKTGRTETMILNQGTPHESIYEHPVIQAYMGKPTKKHFAIIKHVGN